MHPLDSGPIYWETRNALEGQTIVEPWNAATAVVFLLIVLVWVWRLFGRFRRYPFISCCLPVLAAGGVGGTLYHAFRTSQLYLVLDYAPIMFLAVAACIYLWIRLGVRWWYLPLVVGLFVLLRLITAALPRSTMINVSYAFLASLILLPAILVLIRMRFRFGGWVVAGVVSFAAALFFRFADDIRDGAGPLLPMGTHWLWHLFGAAATAFVLEYFYRLEGQARLEPAPA